MKTLTAKYIGNRVIELSENVDLPENVEVLVLFPEEDDEMTLRNQLRKGAESVFARLWDNEGDEVWNEYL